MKNNKYKILVLSGLENEFESILKSAIGFAKMIDANIEFFYVKKPTDIVQRESQLSAMRSINDEYITTNNRLKALVETISKSNDVNMSYSYAIGNVKSEIENRLKHTKPDMVIMGKRKPKTLNFTGDRITDFILKNYEGSVVVTSTINRVEPNKEISLGFFNSNTDYTNLKFVNQLLGHSKKPITSFKTHLSSSNKSENSTQTVEYTFDDNDKFMDNLNMYLKRSDVNLLCLDKDETIKTKSNITDLLDKIEVSLLVTSEQTI